MPLSERKPETQGNKCRGILAFSGWKSGLRVFAIRLAPCRHDQPEPGRPDPCWAGARQPFAGGFGENRGERADTACRCELSGSIFDRTCRRMWRRSGGVSVLEERIENFPVRYGFRDLRRSPDDIPAADAGLFARQFDRTADGAHRRSGAPCPPGRARMATKFFSLTRSASAVAPHLSSTPSAYWRSIGQSNPALFPYARPEEQCGANLDGKADRASATRLATCSGASMLLKDSGFDPLEPPFRINLAPFSDSKRDPQPET